MSVLSLDFAPTFFAASGFDYALQQPLFPGKILLWLLFMLSLLSWAVMVSKAVSFYRMRRADRDFTQRFRAARQPLQLFERNFTDDLSLQWIVYEHGAHEAAFQMLGSPERDATFEARLRTADGMAPSQMNAVREAFTRGEQAASARIRLGLPILSAAAAGAPFLGLLGLVWILMKTFSGASAGANGMAAVSPGIAGGLAVMVVALLVATPAIFGQILITAKGRERLRQLGEFKEEVLRKIEGYDVGESPSAEIPGPSLEESIPMTSEEELPEEVESFLQAEGEAEPAADLENDRFEIDPAGLINDSMIQEEMPLSEIESPFEAVEEGFIETEPEEETEAEPNRRSRFKTPFTEPEINPIAQQTAGLLANGPA